MEICFKDITLSDKAEIDAIMLHSPKRFCEYTFGNMFCWGGYYNIKLWVSDGTFVTGNPVTRHFNFPVGKDALSVVKALMRDYTGITLNCLSENEAELMKDEFGDAFSYERRTDNRDYIYTSQSLCTLAGKKLASKRNHINAFVSEGDYRTERISTDNIGSLYDFNREWCKSYCSGINSSLHKELCATELGLDNFEALGYSGLILYKNGRIAAYCFGEPINEDTFCAHVEKADTGIRGAYQMINREFCREFCTDYEYVNREDDAGDEGLRRAKESYRPTELGIKYTATERN